MQLYRSPWRACFTLPCEISAWSVCTVAMCCKKTTKNADIPRFLSPVQVWGAPVPTFPFWSGHTRMCSRSTVAFAYQILSESVYFVAHESRKPEILPYFQLLHSVVVPSAYRAKLNAGAQLQTFLYKTYVEFNIFKRTTTTWVSRSLIFLADDKNEKSMIEASKWIQYAWCTSAILLLNLPQLYKSLAAPIVMDHSWSRMSSRMNKIFSVELMSCTV